MRNWSKGRSRFFIISVMVFALLLAMTPVAMADSSFTLFGTFDFVSAQDQNLVTGLATTINLKLLDTNGNTYSGGTLKAQIFAADNNVIDDSQRVAIATYQLVGTTIPNVTIDQSGTYLLKISDQYGWHYTQNLYVKDAKVSITGNLLLNYSSTLNVLLQDSGGYALRRTTISVDATNIGGSITNYTTNYDGTLNVIMTPTKMGTVSFNLGGHSLGTIDVKSAYSSSTRIGDNTTNNDERSVLISQQGWRTSDYVVLTRDDVVADAMVAVPLAKKYNAPILMTSSNELNSIVLSEIQRLKAKTVLIMGGEGAVSKQIEDALTSQGILTNRYAGVDRYDTSAQIAAAVGSPGTVYLAYGYGEPDALAASALAAEQGIPILLTDTNTLPNSTKNELTTLAPRSIKLLGGTGVIGSGLEQSLSGSYEVERWGGADRYATEQLIFQSFFANQHTWNSFPVYFASAYVSPNDVSSGMPYGDALFTAALAAKNNGFVITLPPDEIPSSISTFLLYNKVYIPSGTIVGNNAAISYQVEEKLNQLLTK